MSLVLKEKIVPEKITIDIEQQIIDLFSIKKIDYSWSFADKTRKDTTYIIVTVTIAICKIYPSNCFSAG